MLILSIMERSERSEALWAPPIQPSRIFCDEFVKYAEIVLKKWKENISYFFWLGSGEGWREKHVWEFIKNVKTNMSLGLAGWMRTVFLFFFAKKYGVIIVHYTENWGEDHQVYTYYYFPYLDGKVVQDFAGVKNKRQKNLLLTHGSLCLYHNMNHYQFLEIEPSKACSNISSN